MQNTIKIFYGGNYYRVDEFEKISGKTDKQIRKLLSLGFTPEEIIDEEIIPIKKSVVYNGVEYNSITDLAKDLGLNRHFLIKRLNKGVPLDRAVDKRKIERGKMFAYEGQEHNLRHWAEIYGINYYTLYSRVAEQGWSLEDAPTLPVVGKNVDMNTQKESEQ